MKAKFNYIICVLLLFNSCSNKVKTKDVNVISRNIYNTIDFSKLEKLKDTVIRKKLILFIFNNETGVVSLINYNKMIDIGRHTNSLVSKPEIDLRLLDNNYLGIIIKTHQEQFEQSVDGLYLYSYNINKEEVRSLCEFSDIALHNTLVDTLDNLIYFDYFIEIKNSKMVVNEYIPFKNLNLKNHLFKTKSRICKYSLE